MEMIYWNNEFTTILLLNIAIAIILFTSLRLFSGKISNISSDNELLVKDNPAFAISLAGVTLAVTIILCGSVYIDPIYNMLESVIGLGLYGLLGIILMAVARIIFDKIALYKISVKKEIVAGNISAGIIDAGNVIASALVISEIMVWVESKTFSGLAAILGAFVISQIFLTASTYIRLKIFAYKNKDYLMTTAFQQKNVALALKFAGGEIGTAFAIAAASNLVVYEITDYYQFILTWSALSIIVMVFLSILSFLANKVILFRVDMDYEIVGQRNTAIGILEFVILVSLGALILALMS
jgi:uncharacterized membrane protein YjfL (UPF0719 family)